MPGKATPEIERILARLEQIERERATLSPEADGEREALLAEEHQLETRLAELRDEASRVEAGSAKVKAAAQTDLTRTPRLPE